MRRRILVSGLKTPQGTDNRLQRRRGDEKWLTPILLSVCTADARGQDRHRIGAAQGERECMELDHGSPIPSISVANMNWPGALASDVAAVLRSVAETFCEALTERPVEPIVVAPTPSDQDVPVTAYQRTPSGEVQILLNVRGRYWAQLAYQFAHEFCHVLANFRAPVQYPSKWIEESLCETGSLYALYAMGESWKTNPPYPNWASFAVELTNYASHQCSFPENRLPPGTAFRDWILSRLPLLEGDCTRRGDNTVVAQQILPIFRRPGAWRSVRYMNRWDASRDASIEQSCENWRASTPSQLRWVVDSVKARLTEN